MEPVAAIARLVAGGVLGREEASAVVEAFCDERASDAHIAAILTALAARGETVDEIVGAAQALRRRARPFCVPAGALVVDTCGTGGDGRGTLNVSTLAAFVVAAAGVKVAKHGNRALSSRAGSADLLEALGLPLSPPVERLERALDEVGLAFLFAPDFHPATRRVAGVRRQLGVRTLFNLLGPLTNPAQPRAQVSGVYAAARVPLLAQALAALGSEHAWVVYGHGGVDELAPDGPTTVAVVQGGQVSTRVVAPRDFGLAEEDAAGLAGGEAHDNATQARALLEGTLGGAARSSVLMTAAATLHVAGRGSLLETTRLAQVVLDERRALALLERLGQVLS